jgi:hypothetical protein
VRRPEEGCDEVCHSVSNRVVRTATGDVERVACEEQIEEPDVAGKVDPRCRPKARNAFVEVRALPGRLTSSVLGKESL